MKMRVSDYIADFLAGKGLCQVFSVVGGGSMHLNDSLGNHPKIRCLYNHHEQASAMAAEGYAKVHNQPAILCVTSGPGSVNALTGVVGAYQDSIPMMVLSGQAKTTLSLRKIGLNLRTVGGQEVDIVPAIQQNMVKYAEMVIDPKSIRRCMEKAYSVAISGRPGPVWLDIPLDVQGTMIDTDDLYPSELDLMEEKKTSISSTVIQQVIQKLREAKRPVLYAGNGIRLAEGMESFRELVRRLQIPVVTCWNSIDLIATDDEYYCGRGGNMGNRAGNFAVQNSDCLLCIGTRLSVYQVGWNIKSWAREAYTIVVDIDEEELKKPTIRVNLPVCADAADFMQALLKSLDGNCCVTPPAWLKQCQTWKTTYPVVQQRQREEKGTVNVYNFIDRLSHLLPPNTISIVANGSASVVGSQTYYIKENDRFLMNCALSSMGYALPASIGACIANQKETVVCVEGDGSIMMNLQELQTVVTNRLPIKIYVINNNGYHQVRQTQNNLFPGRLVGMGPESGDLGFPNFEKLADAFSMPYRKITNTEELDDGIKEVLQSSSYMLCEVVVSTDQKFEPKSATRRLPDGTLVSPPLEDMAPFLPREELVRNMYIPLWPDR